MKNVLFISSYCAAYRGNFIPSLECLENTYKEGRCVYVFPENARQVTWMSSFLEHHTVYFFPKNFFGKTISFSVMKKLNYLIKKENIHIIHTHFLTYNYSLFIAKYTFARKVRFITHVHNQFVIPCTKSAPIKKFVMELTYDTLIGVSESVSAGLKLQLDHNNITYIDNAICFSRLDNYEKIFLRDNDNQKVVLMAGWPALVKGVDIAVKAILLLRNEGHDIKLCIMQSGDTEQTRKCVMEAIGHYPKWVQILPPREDIATYYNAADIFLSASRSEGLSYAIIEASYSSAMVCCSNIQGNSIEIPNNEIFFVENILACKNAIETILTLSVGDIGMLKEETRKYILDKYDIDTWANKVIEFYS